MSGSEARRDNGLQAESYRRLREVAPGVIDGLLQRLREEGVAAYAAPTAGALTETVWVDSAREEYAHRVSDSYLEQATADLAWQEIVAGFDRPAAEAVPRWPALEDLPAHEPAEPLTEPAEPLTGPATGVRPPRDDEEHYVPAPPPPLPRPDTVGRFAWAGALGGPLLLVLATLAGIRLPGWAGALAVIAFVAGFVTLIARMPDRPPTDTGPDDGAVV